MRLLGLFLALAACAGPTSAAPALAPAPAPALRSTTPRTSTAPEPDVDADGVLDRSDRCPGEPETRNGHRDEDGCPDEQPVGRAYFAVGLAGVPFKRPPPLPRAGAEAPVGYFFHTDGDFASENFPYASPDRFVTTARQPRSTIAGSADTSALPLLRRFLSRGAAPPAGILRSESLVDYFADETPPTGEGPLAIGAEVGPCPWAPAHRLVRIRIQAADVPPPPRLFVLMLDVSGSMGAPERLPLIKHGLTALLDGLRADDRVAMIGLAGPTKVALPPTPVQARADIEAAISSLHASGATRWQPVFEQAQAFAEQRRPGEHLHYVLTSDGADLSWPQSLRRSSNDTWTVIEVGAGDVDDEALSTLAIDHDGHLLGLDTPDEALRAFARLARQGPIAARDIQVQATFDPRHVTAYRLVGHANLQLRDGEFTHTNTPAMARVPGGSVLGRARAGELPAGRGFTVLYEVVPAADEVAARMTVRVQARIAGRDRRWMHTVRDDGHELAATSNDFRFSAAVAALGLLINGGPRGAATLAQVQELAAGALGRDVGGDRARLLALLARSSAPLAARVAEWPAFDAWLAAHPADLRVHIPAGALPRLRFEAMRMRSFGQTPQVRYKIVGRAAAQEGSPREREALARRRAEAVMRYLVEAMRLPPILFELDVDSDADRDLAWGSTVRFEHILAQ